jgi:hypothetical protein
MLAKRPGPWPAAGAAAGAAAGGPARCAVGGYAAVVAGRVCCLDGGADGREGAAVGLDGRLPPPDLP